MKKNYIFILIIKEKFYEVNKGSKQIKQVSCHCHKNIEEGGIKSDYSSFFFIKNRPVK